MPGTVALLRKGNVHGVSRVDRWLDLRAFSQCGRYRWPQLRAVVVGERQCARTTADVILQVGLDDSSDVRRNRYVTNTGSRFRLARREHPNEVRATRP